jgi:uncharacterized protein (DUF58 family)
MVVASGGARVDVSADTGSFRVVRGEDASLRVELRARGRRRRLCRLVEGEPAAPRRSFDIPGLGDETVTAIMVPVDTTQRGLHAVGPFRVVRGDAWSVVRRQVGTSEEGSILVRPRAFPVRSGFAAVNRQGVSETLTRTSGDEHFFALRDYTFGDEPRNVHWRSSARSGRLVVKQKVAAAIDGTLLVLDVDVSAYPSIEAFADGFLEQRFEDAVEVMASLCKARVADGQRVRLMTTGRQQPSLSHESSLNALVDALAVVQGAQPLECDPHSLPATARRSNCSRLIVVTGAPSTDLVGAIRRCASLSPVVVRVGGVPTGPIPGTTVLDVRGPAALE